MSVTDRILERLPPDRREGFLRSVNGLGLAPDAPELALLALQMDAAAEVLDAMRAERQRMAGMLADLPDAMRASGVEIVRGLGDEIAAATTDAIKNETIPLMQRVADVMEQHVAGLVSETATATKDTTNAVGAEIASASSAMSQASANLSKAAIKVGGWTAARIAIAALGVVFATGMFVAGNAVHAADVLLGCPTRVEHITRGLRLSPHDKNLVRNYICKG